MADNEVKTEELDMKLRVPTCPLCEAFITDAADDYIYKQVNPDTRWFWCSACEVHIGNHRMTNGWVLDPYDYEKLKEKGVLS